MSTKVAVIGAGNVGGNLGSRFANSGFAVRYGVKEGTDASAVLARSKGAEASDPKRAAEWADVVFMAVPGSVAVEVAKSLANELKGKIVVDCNNPLVWKEGPVWTPPAEGSLAQAIAAAAPGARVVKAFNQFGAEFHDDPSTAGGPATVFLASDDAEAKKTVSELAQKSGFKPVDSGPIRNAGVLENLAMLWIHLATVGGHGRDWVFSMQPRGAK